MRKVTYEWLVEESDDNGDIFDVSHFDTLPEAQAFAEGMTGNVEIALRREVGKGDDEQHLDIVDRQYAYPGDLKFELGTAIPLALFAQLESLK